MVDRGLAERRPDSRSLSLIESDRRIFSEASRMAGTPDLLSMVRQFPIDRHYQDDRAVIKYWPEQASPGGIEV